MFKNKKYFLILIVLSLLLILTSCINIQINESSNENDEYLNEDIANNKNDGIREDGEYLDVESVASYINKYGKLPGNYITKKEATKLGWVPKEGNLWDVAPNSSIGGDKFGNREGLLPKKESRIYYECDVNYNGGHRGPERIVYSNDGLIYYTKDHYKTFIKLYGDE